MKIWVYEGGAGRAWSTEGERELHRTRRLVGVFDSEEEALPSKW